MAELVGLPCPHCRRQRRMATTFFGGPDGCEIDVRVEHCNCDGGRWELRADLIQEDGHSRDCAEATAKEWMQGRTFVSCALECGKPDAHA